MIPTQAGSYGVSTHCAGSRLISESSSGERLSRINLLERLKFPGNTASLFVSYRAYDDPETLLLKPAGNVRKKSNKEAIVHETLEYVWIESDKSWQPRLV